MQAEPVTNSEEIDTSDWTPLSEWPFPLGVEPPAGWISPGKRRAMIREGLPVPPLDEKVSPAEFLHQSANFPKEEMIYVTIRRRRSLENSSPSA